MIQKLMQNDLWLKIFSVVLAIIIWAFVMQDYNALMTVEKEVSLMVIPHPIYTVYEGPAHDGEQKIAVRVTGPNLFVSKLKQENIRAEVDYTKIQETGKPVPVEINVHGPRSAPRNVTFSPVNSKINVTLVEMATKQVPVTVQPRSETITYGGKEYTYTATTADPLATVSGRTDFLGQVASATINLLPTDKVPGNSEISKQVVPLDGAGKPVDKLDKAVMSVSITWEELPPGKSLGLHPTTRGNLPPGYAVTRLDPEPSAVTIRAVTVGGKLPETETLEIPPVDLAGHTRSFTAAIRMVPPDGTTLSPETVNVAVTIAETTLERRFDNVPIQVHGQASNVEATLAATSTAVNLKGPYSMINALDPAAITAYIDVETVGEGVHRLPIMVSHPAGVTEARLDPVTVEVAVIIK